MTRKFSIDEYTPEEKTINGNGMYGGKRHDEICDYLQDQYKWDDYKINDVSVGIWMAIDAEKAVHDLKMKELEAKLKRCEENLVAIATIFVHAPTMRLEARKCLEFVNPEKYPLNNQWPKIKAK